MTMSRGEKRDHKVEIQIAREMGGLTGARLQSPASGNRQMTIAEYIAHRMGRGTAGPELREEWAMERIGRRRVVRR